MNDKKKTKGTRDAVESSIDLAKRENGTWEGIIEKKHKRIMRWEDITRMGFLEILKKISQPIEKKEITETKK